MVCFCHPNTFSERLRGDAVVAVVVGPGDVCNECRLLRANSCCCCNCGDCCLLFFSCLPNTFSLWSKLFVVALAPTPNNNSKRDRKSAAVITVVFSPCRRRDGRNNNIASPSQSLLLLLLARVILELAALMLPFRCW